MSGRILVLGGGEGWHAGQLREAARVNGCEIYFVTYESLSASIGPHSTRLLSEAGDLRSFDAVLTRTMPAGSLEQVTFRLAILHDYADANLPIVNPPRALEIAIDKYATLSHVAKLGFQVPPTRVVQSRSSAIKAFEELGGDCVIKPIFGGEGRGVMRIQDTQLAWYTFATLEQLNAVFYVQQFIAPGGIDTRFLVVGDQVFGIRRENKHDFRTNVSSGADVFAVDPTPQERRMATQIARSIGLKFASVDIIEADDGTPRVLEVNAIPGWRGAQSVSDINIAAEIISLLLAESCRPEEIAG